MSVTASNLNPNSLIQTGRADLPRASAMNHIFDASSVKFFPFDKIKDGNKLLFAACGNGVLMVEILKRITAANVSIVACDSSAAQLDCAKALAEANGFLSIEWKQGNLNDLSELQGQFNLVHSRFVLNHLPNAKAAVRQLCSTLAPGGHFVSEESGGFELEIESERPEHGEALRSWELMVGLQHFKQKSDLAFGKKIPKTLTKIQMKVHLNGASSIIASTSEQKALFAKSMQNAQHILTPQFMTIVPELTKRLEAIRDDSMCRVSFRNFTQILAEKI